MSKQKRDKSGKIKDSLWTRLKSWWLGRQIRKGKIPRGRHISPKDVHEAIRNTYRGVMGEVWGILSAKIIRANGLIEDLGVICCKKVTTTFRDYIVDSLQDSSTYPMDAFKYHAAGTDSTAEANTDTELGTEVETRATGSQTEGATADIYKTVGTVDFTATRTMREHGILDSTSGGNLMDRSVYNTISVDDGDSIQYTYECTFNAEA